MGSVLIMGKRTDDMEKIIDDLRKSYCKRKGVKNASIKLPQNISFFIEKEDVVIIELNKKSVCKNMQDDEAAFESWALALKGWLDYINKIKLEWERPDNIKDGHYQRFLYRVNKFREIFKWFSVASASSEFLKDSLVTYGEKYIVNFPKNKAVENVRSREAYYEHIFLGKYQSLLAGKADIDNIYNQLPVGLFKDCISKETSLFTGGKSAIDIWGTNKEKNKLSIFELKAPGVRKIGILSELFFYAMFEYDVLNKQFIYKTNCNEKENIRGLEELLNVINSGAKKIEAYTLTTILHPLIDENILELINNSLKVANKDIKFGYIIYSN
jgi:hypothetical protein